MVDSESTEEVSAAVTRDDIVSENRHNHDHDQEITHVTLRIIDRGDDGYCVTEPGVNHSVTGDDVHEAVADYAVTVGDRDE